MDPQSKPSYEVVARRFRPQDFGQVVGQEAIVQSLRSALESGRIPHAFLFSGSRGVGKTTSARILARCLNCEKGPTAEPCGTCPPCVSSLGGANPDVVEIDAASHNLVDDIRQLRDSVGFASMGSRYKVYILDEVHMLTRSAFNAFLKTLEEPPAGVVFVLATTELHKVPDTIRSRCQVLLFERVSEGDIARRLKAIADQEGVAIADEIFADVAASVSGGMRDAESALERILPLAAEMGEAFDMEAYRRLTYRVGRDEAMAAVTALTEGQAGPAIRFAAELGARGMDEREALGEILELLRGALMLVVDGPESDLVSATGPAREALQQVGATCGAERLDGMIQVGLNGRDRMRRLEDRRLVLETCLIRMARTGELASLGDLVEAVRGGALAGGAPGAGAAPAAGALGGAGGSAGGGVPGAGRPDRLQRRLVQKLQDVKPLLVRTVESCSVEGPDDAGQVTLKLVNGSRMHRDRLGSDEIVTLLRQLLCELVGKPVSLRVDTGGGGRAAGGGEGNAGPPGGSSSQAPAMRRAPGPAVERAAKRFDGQIVDLDQETHL